REFVADLNKELQNNTDEGDVTIAYHFLRRDPWYLTFFDRTDRVHIDLYDDVIQKGSNVVQYAEVMTSQCRGRIYFACDEGSRLWLDPQGRVLQVFRSTRNSSTKTYGRNLILFIFEPQHKMEVSSY